MILKNYIFTNILIITDLCNSNVKLFDRSNFKIVIDMIIKNPVDFKFYTGIM
jgi:hypothetical protein